MDPKELFARSLGQATGCINHLYDEHMSNPTPCKEWDVRALMNHMVYELRWMPDLLAGKTVKEVGKRYDGNLLTSNPKMGWQHAADAALMAVKHVDPDKIVHLSYGDRSAKDYILEVGGDILIHTWDLDQGMNCSLVMDPELAQFVYDITLPNKANLAASGLYAPSFEVPNDATIQVKLLALYGRRVPYAPDSKTR